MRVLLAIDGSPHSEVAVAQVARRPWPKGTAVEVLTVLHAAIPMLMEPTLVIAAAHVEQTEDLRKRAHEIVRSAADEIGNGTAELVVTTNILEGSPKDVIVEEARNWNADLIVLGSHGYGRLKRMLLGSVAGAVVANAPCSVQVVRAKELLHPSPQPD